MHAVMKEARNNNVYTELRNEEIKDINRRESKRRGPSEKKIGGVLQTVAEKKRRSIVNFTEYLDLLAKGYAPYQARQKLGIKDKTGAKTLENRTAKLIARLQARKLEELVFVAEIKHNFIYKSSLEEFEKSKIDPKTGSKRPGNPVYLQLANECIRDLRKLLALDRANDFVNNGQVNLFNWDSLHNKQGSNIPQSLPNGQKVIGSSLQESSEEGSLVKLDPVEERIRQLERLAAEKKLENERLIEEHGEPINDYSDSEPVEEIERRIVLKATKTVQPVKTEKVKVSAVVSSLDDLIG